ncbi:phosphoribosylamine--glycine ligase [Sphingorhabdus sp. Alg239-R122]|uniref:phosphoribosylamine--glycine ligase n=1 Tax=Sphingorhabdus sp. Alg239-R122 TaxID=2305989 RepID=UPI0013DD61C1|nr:phosphoribosylamine--glycine ligase [Sphingorhabdus sp. Alg239-R122]
MNILLIGSGGREHALCWKLAQSPLVTKIFAAPGNPGMTEAEAISLNSTDHPAVTAFCHDKSIGLVVIGPEAPLVDGLADSLCAANVPVFGPSAKAAQLEGSKGFTKDLCARSSIPTAAYVRTDNVPDALAALDGFSIPVVIKADGLAAGKGVIIAESRPDAEAAVKDMFDGGFGNAGTEVVIEEFMTGEEASFFAVTDGISIVPLASAQDHKRVGDGDVGPNTGGMGAYSPAPVLTPELERRVMDEILYPTVNTLRAEGMPYSGVLYAGLILTDQGPKLIEYNARFGDPECQVLMMRMRSDLVELMLATAEGKLADIDAPVFADQSALTVVMAARGYPATPEKGGVIGNIEAAETDDIKIFHAGTTIKDGRLVANGGRVLNVTAVAHNVTTAQAAAYKAVDAINFPTGFTRSDIGWREVEREAS